MMAQVNELETAYDNWIDYPVGEKKERDSPFHYHVVDFLLNLANNPTGANEIENPIKKNVMDFSSDEDSDDSSYRSIPPFDWSVIDDGKDPDDLSTWTLTSDENNESADEMPELENSDVRVGNAQLPLVPKIEIPEPKRETLEEVLGPMKRELDLFSEYTDCYGDNPAPWVAEDTKSGFSIICRVPNNLTHDIIQKKKTLANGGIPDRGWKIYHERTVLRHLMFYGLGCFGPSKPGILFDWDVEKDEFVSRQKIGLTWLAPGSLPIKIKTYLPFVNHVRKIHDFFSKYQESQSYTIYSFVQVFKTIFDARTSQFCRRYKRAIHDQFKAFSLLKLDLQSLQMREETELFAELAHEISEKIESSKKELDQDAINTISSIISFYSKACFQIRCARSDWSNARLHQ